MIRTLAATLAATTCIVALATPAAAQTREYNIPAGSLKSALDAYVRQSGRQVVYRADQVRSARSPGVRGPQSAEAALAAILVGSGFTTRVDGNLVAIVKGGNAPVSDRTSSLGDVGVDTNEIVVTAQKREERLIDAPQSVAVLSADTLAKSGIVQLRDFAASVPGLSYWSTGAGQSKVTLRGVTIGNDVSPTVAIVVDDVPYGSSVASAQSPALSLDMGLFDVDRIEVLRGPQGTLYGANTMGGLIKYVTKRPNSTTFSVDAQASLSSTNDGGANYNGSLAINAPIVTDKIGIRASGFYSRDGGYIDNLTLGERDVNRSRIYGGRLDLLLTPTDALDIRLVAFGQNIRREGTGAADYTLFGRPANGSLTQRRQVAEPFDQNFRLLSGTINYDFGVAVLTSISSYQHVDTRHVLDYTALLAPILSAFFNLDYSAIANRTHIETTAFTQEVRLASQSGATFEWLIGGYFTDSKNSYNQEFALRDASGLPAPNVVYTASYPSRFREYAAFGNATYHFSEAFDVSAGIRYAHNRQRFEQEGSGLFAGPAPTRISSDSAVTYLANARYRFTPSAMVYARYATSYRPGGPNLVANDPVTGLPIGPSSYDPDKLASYEIGIKAETRDRTLGIDLTAFYIDWSKIQLLTTTSVFSATVNAPDGATIRGAELSLTARPTRGMIVAGSFAYQNAHLSADTPDLGGRKGDPLPNVPRFTANVTADYAMLDHALRPTIGATLRFVDDRMSNFDGSTIPPQYKLPSNVSVDARAGVQLGPIDAQLFIRNIFDTRGQSVPPFTVFPSSGPFRVAITQPRTIGLSLSSSF